MDNHVWGLSSEEDEDINATADFSISSPPFHLIEQVGMVAPNVKDFPEIYSKLNENRKQGCAAEGASGEVLKNEKGSYKNAKFDQIRFKTEPCIYRGACILPYCQDYHCIGEKRRLSKRATFSEKICKDVHSCADSSGCKFSHTVNEYLYHQSIYKKYDCPLPLDEKKECTLGSLCPFKHSKNREKHNGDEFHLLEELESLFSSVITAQDTLTVELSQISNSMIRSALNVNKDSCQNCELQAKKFYGIPCAHFLCEFCKQKSKEGCLVCNKSSYFIEYSL